MKSTTVKLLLGLVLVLGCILMAYGIDRGKSEFTISGAILLVLSFLTILSMSWFALESEPPAVSASVDNPFVVVDYATVGGSGRHSKR